MFRWRFIRQFPKFALVAAIIVVSTVLFGMWWVFGRKAHRAPEPFRVVSAELASKIEQRAGHLVLIDNELFDAGTGELLLRDWLAEGMPGKLFFDRVSRRFIAQYPNGFVTYSPGGERGAALLSNPPAVFNNDLSWAVFARNNDIWKADIDWTNLTLVNERQVTRIGQFNDRFLAGNTLFGTEEHLFVRLNRQVLKVDLTNGDVKPVQHNLLDGRERLSPDSRYLAGIEGAGFACRDMDTEEVLSIPLPRAGINAFRWMDNDRCLLIANAAKIMLYDRPANTLSDIVEPGIRPNQLGDISTGGRYVICDGRGGLAIVDLKEKKAIPVDGGAGLSWISADTCIFSRDVADSSLRGTWTQKIGETEKRVHTDPLITGRKTAAVMLDGSGEVVIFATREGLMRMNPEGADLRVLKLFPQKNPGSLVTPAAMLPVEEWKGGPDH